MLHQFLTDNRDELVHRTKAKGVLRSGAEIQALALDSALRVAPSVSGAEEEVVPQFLVQLVAILRNDPGAAPCPEMAAPAARNGGGLLRMGFSLSQVVHSYGDICQAITELAADDELSFTAAEFNTLNRSLDIAIAEAVSEYGRQRDRDFAREENERLGMAAHEHRNLLATATLAFQMLEKGTVPIGGSTGAALKRSLAALRALNDRTIAHVRVAEDLQSQIPIDLPSFLAEEEVAAALEADKRGVRFAVTRVEPGLAVRADPLVLSSAVSNLLQNAFKYTRPGGRVCLRVARIDGRVLIDVEDECGGLRPGEASALFPFDRRREDRTGLGLGLTIVRRGVESSQGNLRVRDLPGQGCVFTIDLPAAQA